MTIGKMTTPTDAIALAKEIQADMRWHLDSSGQAHAACTLAAALLAQAEQMGRMEAENAEATTSARDWFGECERMRQVYEAAIVWRDANHALVGMLCVDPRVVAATERARAAATNLLDALNASAGVSSRARLARVEGVVQAARAWRVGRDRNIIGTAPAGGQRSATGVALIDAVDNLIAAGEGEA